MAGQRVAAPPCALAAAGDAQRAAEALALPLGPVVGVGLGADRLGLDRVEGARLEGKDEPVVSLTCPQSRVAVDANGP